ncbi:hypothetical protein NDU88_007112 [Pleurodeles waltl]|uniref:Uncharacterized protein n=1 Tax=Pleurodeles waltl TaxID=8319 RepID=A0AAV7PMU1_PLEWA|nr:hypothetical protein NDU88_007112 [Pleurodeles waltl]
MLRAHRADSTGSAQLKRLVSPHAVLSRETGSRVAGPLRSSLAPSPDPTGLLRRALVGWAGFMNGVT